MVLVHSILWFGFFFFLVFVVPLQEKTLADFKVKLPEDAVTVIGLSQAAHQSIYFVPLLLLLFLVLDGYVLYLLREKVNSMLYSWLWFLLAALVPLLATYYCWRALSAPLLDGLAQ
jgi:type II secretory pathway component PulF